MRFITTLALSSFLLFVSGLDISLSNQSQRLHLLAAIGALPFCTGAAGIALVAWACRQLRPKHKGRGVSLCAATATLAALMFLAVGTCFFTLHHWPQHERWKPAPALAITVGIAAMLCAVIYSLRKAVQKRSHRSSKAAINFPGFMALLAGALLLSLTVYITIWLYLHGSKELAKGCALAAAGTLLVSLLLQRLLRWRWPL